jgi:hypothetical protein
LPTTYNAGVAVVNSEVVGLVPGQEKKERSLAIANRVARWFILRPKIPISIHFGGPWNGKCWYILWQFGIIYDHLV